MSTLRRFGQVVVGLVTLVLMVGATSVLGAAPVLGVAPATPGSSSACHAANARSPINLVIGGREFGPKDGLEVDIFQCELQPGSGSQGIVFGGTSQGAGSVAPLATWGTSYAISTEWWSQLGYDGKDKAAANVFDNKRIIQVCMWYTRGGAAVSDTVCSNATHNSYMWFAGPEKTMSVWDSLNPWDPVTVFNFSTVRINPDVV